MRKLLFCCLLGIMPCLLLHAQRKKLPISDPSKDTAAVSNALSGVKYRLVGPWRGGRSAAVAGSYKNRQLFYMGATGGGVWKTTDGGASWKNISDGFFGGTIGSVAVAPSNESILYVGEGENTVRGNVSEGLQGMWKSVDGGKTWKNIGLKEGRHITKIIIHPTDPDKVWVAVLGHLFGPDEERGIFKTTDGGKTWKKVLYANNQSGASDLTMDPSDPNLLFASTWRVIRTPYSLESGGEGSGLWKSTDGGETWNFLNKNKGLPDGTWGISGVAIAPSNTQKIYALIENANGGLFSSADGGETWQLQSSDNNIRQRAWYYTKLFIDPAKEDDVYVLNVGFLKSTNGGKAWQNISTPHSDHHDLWIDPQDGNRMIIADDGGAQVSMDGGKSWSTMMNQPTAQIYRVSTDNAFPYRILGAQQDNSTLRLKHRTYGGQIGETDWESTAGFESGYVVADPLNPDIVYGGNYGGYLSRLDHKTGENRNISVWPDVPIGSGADVLKYRFQWNFPLFFSPHNPKRLYAAGNHLFVTENGGQSWEMISPDLTTNDKSKQVSSGGPITKDNTSVEYYCTIFTAAESILEKDVLWTGSDDGLVHISRNGGKNWENVTPKGCPEWMMWNTIETDPFKKGGAYIVGTRYKLDDFAPYIYRTEDYGKTWQKITAGIPSRHFTRAVRADKKRAGLLYAGTEYGMYISYNNGAAWQPFQLNLPLVPITDLTIKHNDLIVATQGRSFWMIDDLSVVQQADKVTKGSKAYFFAPDTAWRMAGYQQKDPVNAGMNPPNGVVLRYYLSADSGKALVRIIDKTGNVIRSVETNGKKEQLPWKKGMNTWVWNMQDEPLERVEGMILWNGVPGAVKVPPGNYAARFVYGKDSTELPFVIAGDKNFTTSPADYEAQYSFLKEVKAGFKAVQDAIIDIRAVRSQINVLKDKTDSTQWKALQPLADSIQKGITAIEETLHQTKAKSGQDVLNYPIRLNDKISGVFDAASSGNMAPSKQARDVFHELKAAADIELQKLKSIMEQEVAALNKLARMQEVPFIHIKKE
ncbi:MAG: WD40/YVTN/BNR-like repeat-containing protein [Chitinophagaceae bacterium]